MALSLFIQSLLTTGKVSLQPVFIPVEKEEVPIVSDWLAEYYRHDLLEMPSTAPPFEAAAAAWAARYFYMAVQLTILRDQDEAVVNEQLIPYAGAITPAVMYSADLVLRHLPALFTMARGLAPDDIVIKHLRDTAQQWPLSSVGIEAEDINEEKEQIVLSHPSLKQVYIERIILRKDKLRVTRPGIEVPVREHLGIYAHNIWPQLEGIVNSKQ